MQGDVCLRRALGGIEIFFFCCASPQALTHTKRLTCVALSPDGKRLAAGDVTGRIVIWHNVGEAAMAAAAAAVAAATMQPVETDRGAAAAAGSNAGSNLVPAATVHWHAHPVGCLAFSPDGHYLLSGALLLRDFRFGHGGSHGGCGGSTALLR